jgi:type VI secretion system protein ImpH
MLVAFMGLTGPGGVLPQHYTTLLLQRLRLRDHSLRDFFDVFNHRVVSLFYRAWEKYRFPLAYERARREDAGEPSDLFTECLFCLVGLGTAALRERLAADDAALLYYAGFFAHAPRSAVCLERLLTEHFGMAVTVEQFEGQWLALDADEQSQLAGPGWPLGRNTQLGVDLIAGDRIWDVQSKVRLRVGPMNYAQFHRLLPTGSQWPALVQLARTYLGPELDFDVQLVLRPLDVPWWQLTPEEDEGGRLGWDVWSRSHDFHSEVDDVILPADG